ncbi:hypothetical protein L7F22_008344 [Adiantum nelumboides]|nr:hypothetical protein [Adiantum nelumboides]
MGEKWAMLVGCNYHEIDNELQGCNDVIGMYKMLVDKFGFANDDVMVLVDTNNDFPLPTDANICGTLHLMVQDAQPIDTFFFHFSGHGICIPIDAGMVDNTGFNECICPCDCDATVAEHIAVTSSCSGMQPAPAPACCMLPVPEDYGRPHMMINISFKNASSKEAVKRTK